ncbi:leucine rich repeat family protein [Stylonychia lemnae]|uniref:Leucine rich repeat family protein n=1 Tax=Stylonychia lemnae TaxID=5949 RepID=A0A078AUV7_STYLE|nr:leucine rich repeat family protein [Stylonychia lemnae]|eukprot:CDW85027.1 leucine rich repeat family protein [Stylonychia lemnae]
MRSNNQINDSKSRGSGRVVAMSEFQPNNNIPPNMYSSHESNMVLSDNNSAAMNPQSRGKKFFTKINNSLDRKRQIEPNVYVQSKESKRPNQDRGKSMAMINDQSGYQPNMSRPEMGQHNRVGSSDVRGNKMQKTAYDKKKDWQAFPVKIQDMNQMIQIRKKKPKLKYYDKLAMKAQQERQIYSQQVQHRGEAKRKTKILDGFLLLYSCRVKLPHEAIRSKLSGENIVDVREEDLVYFKQNLKYLDVSDNNINIDQLINLQNLEELDLQYNNLDNIQLQEGVFPQLAILHLSYNKIPPSHLQQLQYLPKLRVLNIASNDFCTLPSDLSFLKCLEEINLSSNNFSTDSLLVNPNKLFAAMATIPSLKKLNLSRNKFKAFHSEDLSPDNLHQEVEKQAFSQLQELNFAFNLVENEEDLMYCVLQLPSLLYLVVTGNPFAIKGDPFATANLEQILQQKGGKLINETLQPPTYLRRQKSKRQDGRPPLMLNYNFPQSREMVVVSDQPLSRPNVFREQEDLFPLPPKEERIQAIEYQQENNEQQEQDLEEDEQDQQNENRFFITEDEMLRGNKSKKDTKAYQKKDQEVIKEEENNDPNIQNFIQDTNLENDSNIQQIFDEDFGKLKMEKFKEQCRQILGPKKKEHNNSQRNIYQNEFEEPNQSQNDSQFVNQREYDTFLDIINAYKTLKQAVNKPSTVHGNKNQGGSKGYLKMTIAATQHSKSNMNKDLLEYSLANRQDRISSTAVGGQRALLPSNFDNGQDQQRVMYKRPTWRKTKQEVIDEKVERLFESYKLMDDVNKKQLALNGIQEQETKNAYKYKYFPKEEDDDEEDDE